MPVIAGTGSNSTREAIELTQAARAAGADAALLISPYYNKPTQEGIYQHYRAVASEGGLPMRALQHPGRTASRIEPETIARLSRVPGIAALKECGGDLFATSRHDRALRAGLQRALGRRRAHAADARDRRARRDLDDGERRARARWSALVHARVRRATSRARASAHYALLPLMEALFLESNPIPVKTALAILGRIPNATLRLPLTEISKANRDRLEAVLAELPRA